MDSSEIKSLMTSLEKATSVEKIKEILVIFDKEIAPTEKLLRVSISVFGCIDGH
jgi:hypothetical protein